MERGGRATLSADVTASRKKEEEELHYPDVHPLATDIHCAGVALDTHTHVYMYVSRLLSIMPSGYSGSKTRTDVEYSSSL